MIHGKSFLWSPISCALILLLSATCRADDAPAASSSTLEIIRFTAPAGWEMVEKPGQPVRVFTAPGSNASQQTLILILIAPPTEKLDLRASYEAVIKQITSDGKVVESTDIESKKTRQGFEALTRTLVTEAAGGDRMYVRAVGANVENRLATFLLVATNENLYKQHQGDMDDLLKSVSFDAKPGVPMDAPPAAAPGGEKSPDTQQLLAKAKEQFAKDLPNRRKARTILGDIRNIDGKPIPDVASYNVVVFGTTMAAERTRYTLDVDQQGHFEQLLPDGIYKVSASCIVNFGGHRLPVDLVWLDEKEGIDQPSMPGIVRDFRLVASGLKPGADPKADGSYFGGFFRVSPPRYDAPGGLLQRHFPGGKVLFILTPQGPLIDGSRIDPLTIEMDTKEVEVGHPPAVPLGIYKLSVVAIDKDGNKTQLFAAHATEGEGNTGKYFPEIDLFWERATETSSNRTSPMIYLTY